MSTKIDLNEEFPIKSQTSDSDKLNLLQIRDLLGSKGTYKYLEIGSFLGGSLTPFLRDPKCTNILSIDDRERAQPDERGKKFDYAGITNETMINALENANLDTQKLKTFNGSIEDISDNEDRYDLIFIDGEHTDRACFRDFIYSERLFNENCIIAFHDSTLIYKSLKIICVLLKSRKSKFSFIKVKGSKISFLFINSFSEIDLSNYFIPEDLDSFYSRSEAYVLLQAATNRVQSRLTLKGLKYFVKEAPVVKVNKDV